MKKSSIVTAAAIVSLTAALAVQAVLPLTATRNGNFTFAEPATVFVPLNNAGALVLNFNTTANNQKVVIAYTAECSDADNIKSWLNIDILVDGAAVPPTNTAGGADAFCTADAGEGNEWRRNAVNAVITVPAAGAHTVRVRANIVAGNGGAIGWLGDSSLVVFR